MRRGGRQSFPPATRRRTPDALDGLLLGGTRVAFATRRPWHKSSGSSELERGEHSGGEVVIVRVNFGINFTQFERGHMFEWVCTSSSNNDQ